MPVPKNIIAPPRKGPVRMRKSGAGRHAQGPRRERARSAGRAAAISREVAAQ
jgi:hypothetical protein